MKKIKFGIVLLLAVLSLVAVVSAALPDSVSANINHIGTAPSSYVLTDITAGGNIDLPDMTGYLGWCADSHTTGIDTTHHTFTPYDTRYEVTPGHPVLWNQVNYILNNKNGANKWAVQQAIWYFDNGRVSWNDPGVPKVEADVQRLIHLANGNTTYVPTDPYQKYGVLLWNEQTKQPIFIEATIPEEEHHDAPEFPSLALPVAMLVGLVGAVQYIRTREE